jgi:hypothetical protein
VFSPLCLLFQAQRGNWIHAHRATRGKKTGEERGHGKQQTRTDQRERIALTDLIQNLREHTSLTQRKQKADADGKRRLYCAFTHNQREPIRKGGRSAKISDCELCIAALG